MSRCVSTHTQVYLTVRATYVGRYHPFDERQNTKRQTGFVGIWHNRHGDIYRSKRCSTDAEAARLAYAYFDRHLCATRVDATEIRAAWNRRYNGMRVDLSQEQFPAPRAGEGSGKP